MGEGNISFLMVSKYPFSNPPWQKQNEREYNEDTDQEIHSVSHRQWVTSEHNTSRNLLYVIGMF